MHGSLRKEHPGSVLNCVLVGHRRIPAEGEKAVLWWNYDLVMANGGGGDNGGFSFERVLEKALQTPWVRVDRKAFLLKQADGRARTDQDRVKLLSGGLSPFFTEAELVEMGRSCVLEAARNSTAVSVASGLPGGILGSATGLTVDTLQTLLYAIRISQELAILYGYQIFDGASDGGVSADERDRIILFLGALFGVDQAASAARLATKELAADVLARLPRGPQARSFRDPVLARILALFQVKFTKAAIARGAAKAVPIIGAVGVGGFNYASMRYSGFRLNEELAAGFDYPADKQRRDLEIVMARP